MCVLQKKYCAIFIVHDMLILCADEEFKELSELIQQRFRESEPHKFEETKWQLNQACIAFFHLDQQWYRAKIISLEPHRVKVKSKFKVIFALSEMSSENVTFYGKPVKNYNIYYIICSCSYQK